MAKRSDRKTGAPRARPTFHQPMATLDVNELPEGDEWLYEVKFDGHRALLIKDANGVQIRSRSNKDVTRLYPSLAQMGRRLRAESAVVDGEIVAVSQSGRSAFHALQHRSSYPGYRIVFYAFDLLHHDGVEIIDYPLDKRRALLAAVVADSGIVLSADLHGSPAQVIQAVRAVGLEGVIAKQRHSRYEPGAHSGTWMKLKLEHQREFVIGGYRPDGNKVDSLLVGYYAGARLHFAGKVRAGFVRNARRSVLEKLLPLRTRSCPFIDLPTAASQRWSGGVKKDEMKQMQWVEPLLIAQIRFSEWTEAGHLRLGKFLSLRTDTNPRPMRSEMSL
jgi:bifunctional non-homologous end joining protein LigD